MDWWLRGRVIYAYLLWVVFKLAAAGGFFDSMVGEMVVEAGKNVTLNCPGVTEDSLILMLEWRADGRQLLEYSSSITTVWFHQSRVSLSSKDYALQFHPCTADDTAEYTCLVNGRSTPEAVIKLIVQDVPNPPDRPLVTNFTSKSVNLSWAPSVNSYNNPISYYIIETRIHENGPWNATKEIVTPNNNTYYTIENLRPFTVYSFRVSAVNAMGRSKPSPASYYIVTLRELPDGKPIITSAYNTSATSIFLAWKAPSRDTIHGEFLGYKIGYRPRDKTHMEVKTIYIRDPAVDNHSIHNLETYTQYLVSLQVFNPAGHGPATTVSVMTDEGVPTKPLNLTSNGINSTTIELSWAEPDCANGIISGYRIYYMYSNYTDVQMYKINEENGPIIDFLLKELKPDTEYKIWVKAYTWKNEGEPSDHIIRRTDISGPSAPLILNVTCQTHDSVYIQWARPNYFRGSIDYYFINYRIENSTRWEEIEVIAEKDHLESATIIPNLTMNTVYEICVLGGTWSTIDNRVIIHGNASVVKKVRVARDCDKIPPLLSHNTTEFSSGIIAGMVCACLAVMLMITSFILWKPCLRPIFRKCFHTAYYFLDYPPRNVPTLQEWENTEQDGERTAVAIQKFVQHVASLHADGDIGFSKEYEFIQSETGKFTAENSQCVENKAKNRYMNIVAYDHTRVQLLSCGGGPPKKGHDYVNANYIDGWQRTRAYIGTQGPLPPTFDGFWRMVWEQRVSIVVMITNLVERGRKKCDMYWPKKGSETYGCIQVTLLREDIMATYTIRTLQIRHLKVKKRKNGVNMGERIVWQYHFTGWPDHGVPEHPLPVLSFIRKSSNANPPDAGPIVVHCSAGVGRTGTYIVIDAMLKQAKCKNEVNVFGFLKHIRTQRNLLVQTEEQYVFIHHALQEAIESGETNIEVNKLMEYVQDMLNPNNTNTDAWNNIEAQYKLVTSWKPKEFNLVSAMKPCNLHKNRSQDVISIETARVHLTPKPGIDGSDYINATWIAGFHHNREFIITQHPMDHTITEFWQMMWDCNAQTVVMLTECDEEYPEFWPTEGKDLKTETFRVRSCGIKETANGIILREVAVRSLQDDYELTAKIVQGPRSQPGFWPHNINPRLLVTLIHDLHRDYQNGPIVVMDRYGGVEAAVFVLLTTLNKQLEFEKSADIYMFAKLLYMKRPGIFRSKEDYVLLYQTLEAMLSSKAHEEPDLYSMANGHVSTMTNSVEVPTSSMQHMQMDYSQKPMIREYATVKVNSMNEYSIPICVDHSMEPCSSRSSESCLSIHATNEHEKNIVMTHQTVSYHNHPGSVSVIVDANGYVTNGSMRVPPEGMETSCKILPQ
ncbi:putative receptor-type tyrosine-protein phosphatase mosPTP-1 isoform X2 [Calliopsis andreniformis]|uniref:putative receptor-type tyrosine-protein phosphatase mosPTP-1 isoform X2 n=1 Tax=Calliopsis andreniformis TaxID=337506 RepID=UPI003FCDE8A2